MIMKLVLTHMHTSIYFSGNYNMGFDGIFRVIFLLLGIIERVIVEGREKAAG